MQSGKKWLKVSRSNPTQGCRANGKGRRRRHTAWFWLLCSAETCNCFGFAVKKLRIDGVRLYYCELYKKNTHTQHMHMHTHTQLLLTAALYNLVC